MECVLGLVCGTPNPGVSPGEVCPQGCPTPPVPGTPHMSPGPRGDLPTNSCTDKQLSFPARGCGDIQASRATRTLTTSNYTGLRFSKAPAVKQPF